LTFRSALRQRAYRVPRERVDGRNNTGFLLRHARPRRLHHLPSPRQPHPSRTLRDTVGTSRPPRRDLHPRFLGQVARHACSTAQGLVRPLPRPPNCLLPHWISPLRPGLLAKWNCFPLYFQRRTVSPPRSATLSRPTKKPSSARGRRASSPSSTTSLGSSISITRLLGG
jgi:hypothetical protein